MLVIQIYIRIKMVQTYIKMDLHKSPTVGATGGVGIHKQMNLPDCKKVAHRTNESPGL